MLPHHPQVEVNCHDHVVVASEQQGCDVVQAFEQVCSTLAGLEKQGMDYAVDEKLGYLGCSLDNIGAALQVSFRMNLPLMRQQEEFQEILDLYQLEAVECGNQIYDIRNKVVFGIAEDKIVQQTFDGAVQLAKMESLAADSQE